MDDARTKATLIEVCSGLARLQLRLLHAYHAAPARFKDDLRLREMQPPSPWLDARSSDALMMAAIDAVAFASAHLLGLANSTVPVDARHALLALQYIQGEGAGTWGTPTRRLASRLGHSLAATPLEEFHGACLTTRDIPRASRIHRAPT